MRHLLVLVTVGVLAATVALGRAPGASDAAAPAGSVWREAADRGVLMRAAGSQPDWVFELEATRAVLQVGETYTELLDPVVRETGGAIERVEGSSADGREVVVRLAPTPCTDVLTGEVFTRSARVEVGGLKLDGCARELSANEVAE